MILRRSVLPLALGGFASLAAAQPALPVQKLRVGVAVGYAPFSEVGSDGRLEGFEVDLVNALCARMGVQCMPVITDFDGLIPALQARKIDAIMASMSITPERQQTIAFSAPYYYSPARMVVKNGARLDISPAGMKGKRIGVERGTVHARFLADQFTGSEVVRYATQDQVFLDLKSGRLDALLADAVAADFGFLRKPEGKGFGFAGPDFRDERYFGRGIGVGLRKAEAASLGKRIDDALQSLRSSGALKALNDRYFSLDLVNLPR